MFKKIAALATAAVLCAGLMAGCGASSTTEMMFTPFSR